MTIAQSDLVFCAAASSPYDDDSTSGGAIDESSRIMESILSSRETLEVVSDGADTRNVTIVGRNYGGEKVIDVIELNGTTVVVGNVEFYTVLEILLSATSATRTVSVRQNSDNTVLQTIGPNLDKYTSLFKCAFPSESQSLVRYEKIFALNNHATDTLLDAVLRMYADLSGNFEYGLAAAQDDSVSVTDRLTAPSSITFYSSTSVYTDIPGTDIAAGSAIGIWVKQTLAAKERPSIANSKVRFMLVGGTA